MRKRLLLYLLFPLVQPVFSQDDSQLYAAAFAPIKTKDAGDPLFYGRQHVNHDPRIEGLAFYETDDWQKGTVVYRDLPYQEVFLKYDLVRDEVLVRHPNGVTPVVLFSPRIHSFTLGNRRFLNLAADVVAPYKAGIYEELRAGKLTLYVKRSKLLEETIVSNVMERKFIDNHSYYIMTDGKFLPIKKEKAIMALVGEQKKAIKAALKADGIKFRKNPEAALLLIVDLYNQSTR